MQFPPPPEVQNFNSTRTEEDVGPQNGDILDQKQQLFSAPMKTEKLSLESCSGSRFTSRIRVSSTDTDSFIAHYPSTRSQSLLLLLNNGCGCVRMAMMIERENQLAVLARM